jgi:hypothetical protein
MSTLPNDEFHPEVNQGAESAPLLKENRRSNVFGRILIAMREGICSDFLPIETNTALPGS